MTSKRPYLIVDIGTGNVRVAVAESSGTILGLESGEAHCEKDYNYPESIYFSPDALWQQISDLTRTVLQKIDSV